MSEVNPGARKKRRRSAPLLWGSGLVASAVLALGVNGTLSSWTDAIINNSHNSAASAAAVRLVETLTTGSTGDPGGEVCDTATVNNNPTGATSVTCSTINKYGGIAQTSGTLANPTDAYGVRLSPDGPTSQAVTVTLANEGTATANLSLTPSACSSSAYPGETGNTTYDLCTQMNVQVVCGTATVYNGLLSGFSATTPNPIQSLAPGASVACTFTVSVPSTLSSNYASLVATQALTWELKV